MRIVLVLSSLGVLVWSLAVDAEGPQRNDETSLPPPAAVETDFARDIEPIFQATCQRCHGPEKQEGELRLDLKEKALIGGLSGPAIVPGDSAASRLVQYVAGVSDDEIVMPPEGDRLTAEQIGLVRAWIDQGAVWPDDPAASVAADLDNPARWAFRPPLRPEPPAVRDAAWPRNDIDRFVLARLEAAGLSPSPEADRRTLIRRLSFDLVGLPPAPEEVQAFLADTAPDAFERLVDRLLASPRYGERWGRHWLDVVRFAESHGFEMNQPRPNAWPYRDWVIQSFNDDKPYDQFIVEQLAGDALGADAATGFLVAGPWDQVKSPDPVLTAQQRADELHDMAATTGSVFLGLTVGCARCHNHKFDPISQREYYALQACLAGVQHGERPLATAQSDERVRELAEVEQRIAGLRQVLARFEPLVSTGHTILIDDEDVTPAAEGQPGVTLLAEKRGQGVNPAGAGRGQKDDPGDAERLPNASHGRYTWWDNVPGRDVFAYAPRAAGQFRIWISWGCGYETHTTDAQYLLDLDGDLGTTADQEIIARVDQQRFAGAADGTGLAHQALWSGFWLAGIHSLRPESRIILRGGSTGSAVTADVIVLEEVLDPSDESAAQPRLRAPVTVRQNIERFEPVPAKAMRFTVLATNNGSEPCIDELEIFATAVEGVPRNVALASAGAQATASGTLSGFDIHQLEHINDGQYGNGGSWISNTAGSGWVQIDLAEPVAIDRVVWGRDRELKYLDRLATRYVIEAADPTGSWHTVAGSYDRVPSETGAADGGAFRFAGLATGETAEAARLAAELVELEKTRQRLSATPMVYSGRFVEPGPTYRLHRGDPMQPREPVEPGGIEAAGFTAAIPADAPERERRLALAHWIASTDNPLAARVMVNRLWQHHFGEGLVATPSDFGANGARPTHSELLDWLATEFVAQGWRMKALHRLIVTSASYRQSSASWPEALAADAGSRLLWRFPPRRLEAEPIRDAILWASGTLDLGMGGPGYEAFEPNNNYVHVYTPKHEFGPAEWRRMVYEAKPRMELDETFGAFDCPDAGQVAPRRNHSTTPLQALNLLNSRFMLQQAAFFAARLEREASPQPADQVRRAFWIAFSRAPDDDELAASVRLIGDHGLSLFCRALFNANEFVYVE